MFLLETTRGLERFCADEVADRLKPFARVRRCTVEGLANGNDDGIALHSAHVVVRVAEDVIPMKDLYEILCSLRSVRSVGAYVTVVNGLVHDEKVDEKTLEDCIDGTSLHHWQRAIRIHDAIHPKAVPTRTTFRVTCTRNRHLRLVGLKSPGVCRALGSAVVDSIGWKVDCVHYDVNVVGFLSQDLMVGLMLRDEIDSGRGRSPECSYSTMLRPSLAYLLTRVARIQPGETVVDPMCGTGTIPIEAALALPCVTAIGGDSCWNALEDASRNAKSCRLSSPVSFLLWDGTSPFIRPGSVDVVISDLPFGHRHSRYNRLDKMYQGLMNSIRTALRPGSGRAALLTICKHRLVRAVDKFSTELSIIDSIECDVGGFQAVVLVIERLR